LGRGHVKRIKDQVKERREQMLLNIPMQHADRKR